MRNTTSFAGEAPGKVYEVVKERYSKFHERYVTPHLQSSFTSSSFLLRTQTLMLTSSTPLFATEALMSRAPVGHIPSVARVYQVHSDLFLSLQRHVLSLPGLQRGSRFQYLSEHVPSSSSQVSQIHRFLYCTKTSTRSNTYAVRRRAVISQSISHPILFSTLAVSCSAESRILRCITCLCADGVYNGSRRPKSRYC